MALSVDDLPNDIETLKALLVAAHAATDAADARAAALATEVDRLTERAERLDHIVSVLRRAQFGRRSERIADDQIELALEDVETGFGVEDAAVEAGSPTLRADAAKTRRANRGHLPKHLPREEIVIAPERTDCPCCGGDLHVIGEDVSERLDKMPARLRVIVTRRPKYACRTCERTGADETAGIIQAPAPPRLVPGGLPSEALVADVLVAKYADHLPLYRQSQMLARDGIAIDRSTLANWVGFAAFELAPLHERLVANLKASDKLFADETRCPVLDPGRGRTKTGYLWAIARDDRPWCGRDPPAVAYLYAPGRGKEHAIRHLAGFSGTLQVDGYAAYDALTDGDRIGGAVTLALCWSHFRRRFYDIAKGFTTLPRAATRRSRTRRCSGSVCSMRSRPTSVGAPATSVARPAGSRGTRHRGSEALAREPAQARVGALGDRGSHALRALTLGRPHPLPRRRPHRDRHQRGRAVDPTDRLEPEERALRGIR